MLGDGLRFPLREDPGLADRVIARVGVLAPIRCTVCGRLSRATRFSANLRETGFCSRCGATNRNRQLAQVACLAARELAKRPVASLRAIRDTDLAVYNTESRGALHEQLRAAPGYRSSEYLGPQYAPGEQVGGLVHEDLLDLSFDDGSVDLVLSSDVLEHVPDPYRAHAEVYRVLRVGGHHVFTVPFHLTGHLDHVRARLGEQGEPELLAEPLYHEDPLRDEGVLVYTIFGLEMLVHLARMGFATRFFRLWQPWHGIVGPDAIVFDAVK